MESILYLAYALFIGVVIRRVVIVFGIMDQFKQR